MTLHLVTPTRKRWGWMQQQAMAILPQLREGDTWIIVVDNDSPSADFVEVAQSFDPSQLIIADLSYARPRVPVGCVNRARNVGALFVPQDGTIVDVDDHDLLAPDALDAIREAMREDCYVFGHYAQMAYVPIMIGGNVQTLAEPWPDVRHEYTPGALARGEIDGIGLRACSKQRWDALGGWSPAVWPGADKDFAVRYESRWPDCVRCLAKPLCTVAIEPDSLMAQYRGSNDGDHLDNAGAGVSG